MSEIMDEFEKLRTVIADERTEVLAKIQELIDAGNNGDKITVAMVKQLQEEVSGIYKPEPPPA